MPTRLKDVARSAGVSIATVSRVLAEKPYISPAVRTRVLQAVSELNYRPNRVARSLQAQRARVIGLLLPDIRDHFFTALVRAVEDIAYMHRYAFLLCSTDEDVAKSENCVELMQAEHVAGVLVVPTPGAEPAYQRLVETAIPVVAIERRIAQTALDAVLLDHAGPVCRRVTELIEAGHERIGAILTYDEGSGCHARGSGYRRALAAHGLPVLPELIRSGPATPSFGRQAIGELLELSPSPTAVFVAAHLQALGVMQTLAARRLTIPDDVAVVGVAVVGDDGCEEASLTSLAFADAKPPAYLVGETATNLLLARIGGSTQPPQEVVLPTNPM
jgi:DNA-binding LacI/PurR family transcriptional regulator